MDAKKINIELEPTDVNMVIAGLQQSNMPSIEANRLCQILGAAMQAELKIEPKNKKRKKKK